jgi:hypothetical protein
MHASVRTILCLTGLAVSLVAGGSAGAAPLPLPKPSPNPGPTIPKNPKVYDTGLAVVATVTPVHLRDSSVNLDITRPLEVRATQNRVVMTKHTQLVMTFKARASKGYRLDCKFTNNQTINVMEFADGKIVRQTRGNAAGGVLHHTISSAPKLRDMKLFLQPTGDTDWNECKITPL